VNQKRNLPSHRCRLVDERNSVAKFTFKIGQISHFAISSQQTVCSYRNVFLFLIHFKIEQGWVCYPYITGAIGIASFALLQFLNATSKPSKQFGAHSKMGFSLRLIRWKSDTDKVVGQYTICV